MGGAILTIKDVHARTGIPVTTLKFYEKELPDFFSVQKTEGGHRRYSEESVQQFLMIRKMVETDGIRLGQIRDTLARRGEGEIRHHVDLLLSVYEALTRETESLKLRVESLELQLAALKKANSAGQRSEPSPKKRWFS